MRTLSRPSVIHVASEEAAIPLPERVTIALAALGESAREGLPAFCVGVGLSVAHEILKEAITQLVGPRGKHDPERPGYSHGQEDRRWTAAGVLEAEKQFRRVNGYSDLQLLRLALERTLPVEDTPIAAGG